MIGSNVNFYSHTVPQLSFLTAEPINATSIAINWNTTAVSIVDSYTLTYTRICDSVETSLYIEDSVQTNVDIHNLVSGLQYNVSIKPENILGKGTEMFVSTSLNETREWILNIIIIILTYPFILLGPPGTPQLYPPVVLDSTSIRVEWDEVECTQRNGIIASYVIQYNNINGSSQKEVIANAESTSIVINGLNRFSLYSISIAAVNSIGTGVFSEMITFFTCKLIKLTTIIYESEILSHNR